MLILGKHILVLVDMSFLTFLGKVFLLDWLLGDDVEEKVARPPKPTYDYGREDDYFDKIHSLESRINELERQQDRCDYTFG